LVDHNLGRAETQLRRGAGTNRGRRERSRARDGCIGAARIGPADGARPAHRGDERRRAASGPHAVLYGIMLG
jgi:hypothetical protein